MGTCQGCTEAHNSTTIKENRGSICKYNDFYLVIIFKSKTEPVMTNVILTSYSCILFLQIPFGSPFVKKTFDSTWTERHPILLGKSTTQYVPDENGDIELR